MRNAPFLPLLALTATNVSFLRRMVNYRSCVSISGNRLPEPLCFSGKIGIIACIPTGLFVHHSRPEANLNDRGLMSGMHMVRNELHFLPHGNPIDLYTKTYNVVDGQMV